MTASVTPSVGQLAFGDLAHELASTRRVLERVPDGKHDWAPHEKSMSLGQLANHVADMPQFMLAMVERDELDFKTTEYKLPTAETRADMLAHFDAGAARLANAVAVLDAEALAQTWTMRSGDHVILAKPRGALVRGMGINHLVHHRAQLGVYLRLLDIPLPALYGPSADERG